MCTIVDLKPLQQRSHLAVRRCVISCIGLQALSCWNLTASSLDASPLPPSTLSPCHCLSKSKLAAQNCLDVKDSIRPGQSIEVLLADICTDYSARLYVTPFHTSSGAAPPTLKMQTKNDNFCED
eukprot:962443-Amphidinium_carterae.1